MLGPSPPGLWQLPLVFSFHQLVQHSTCTCPPAAVNIQGLWVVHQPFLASTTRQTLMPWTPSLFLPHCIFVPPHTMLFLFILAINLGNKSAVTLYHVPYNNSGHVIALLSTLQFCSFNFAMCTLWETTACCKLSIGVNLKCGHWVESMLQCPTAN